MKEPEGGWGMFIIAWSVIIVIIGFSIAADA